jgi:integrase
VRGSRPEALVLGRLDPDDFRHREWRRIIKRADLPGRSPKDLRDTYARQLLSAGVQLGHADVSVTARHYAR